MVVADDDSRMFERHGEETVETPVRHNHNRNRIDAAGLCMPAAEEITDRALHRGGFLTIPIAFEYQVTQHVRSGRRGFVRYCHPHMADDTRAVNIHQGHALTGLDCLDAGASFAGGAERAGCGSRGSFAAGGVLRIDTTGAPSRCQCQGIKLVSPKAWPQHGILIHIVLLYGRRAPRALTCTAMCKCSQRENRTELLVYVTSRHPRVMPWDKLTLEDDEEDDGRYDAQQ